MNRAERRREARRKITVGENLIVTGTGQHIDVDRHPERNLPPKTGGRHRWMVFAAFYCADPSADGPKFMDQENLISVGTGCYDCEQPWRPDNTNEPCPAPEAP